jgi:hypothetical protein
MQKDVYTCVYTLLKHVIQRLARLLGMMLIRHVRVLVVELQLHIA